MSLELKHVQITRKGQALFAPICLNIFPGETATVMGASGCGKSTLLSAICGSLSREFRLKGEILLKGHSINPVPMERRNIGILFQDDLLFPHMSIGSNLAFALPPGMPRYLRDEKVKHALGQAGLEGFEDRDPATLSGGQRSRASLLRTLLARPKALLLDEPFSRLDHGLKGQIREFVFDQVKKMNIPALLVTHDPGDMAEGPLIDLTTHR
ncbi:MAG: ATP-binding cassette domain-containing protein [Desulfobacterium sp.]|nr:ATP-binding cassette domain-containing protein [Desulfobacterium sp.]